MDERRAVPARWTDDCQGKKDYDGELVSLSTRYWPRGGSADVFDRSTGTWLAKNMSVAPSARAMIMLRTVDAKGDEDFISLIDQGFEGETFETVKAQVETWASTQYERIWQAPAREFTA